MDGELEYGSAILTFTPSATGVPTRADTSPFTAIADPTFTVNDSPKVVNQTGKYGSYAGGFGVRSEPVGGSCSIQLPSGRRTYVGDLFVVDVENNDLITAGTTLFEVRTADNPYTKDGYRVQAISYIIRKFAADNTTPNTPVIYGT